RRLAARYRSGLLAVDRLPARDEPRRPAPGPPRRRAQRGRRHGVPRRLRGRRRVVTARVLVVEDEAVVSMDIVASLARLGYEAVGTAATGERAVELAESARPDLVLMDIHLAGEMDGVEAARRIRASTHAPVVYLTAYSDDETLRRAKLTEPFGYAVKPFEERELHILIEIALRKHALEERLRRAEELLSGVL